MTCSSCSAKMTATCGRRSASIAKSNLRTICRHCLPQSTSDIILFEFLEMLMMRVLHFQWSPSWKVSFDSPRVLHNFPTSISYRDQDRTHLARWHRCHQSWKLLCTFASNPNEEICDSKCHSPKVAQMMTLKWCQTATSCYIIVGDGYCPRFDTESSIHSSSIGQPFAFYMFASWRFVL